MLIHKESNEVQGASTLKHSQIKKVQSAVHKIAKGKSLIAMLKEMRKKDAQSE